jgi:hypothetical protein
MLALAACGKASQGYPPDYEFNFTRACATQGAGAAYCACTWDKIEANIPAADFAAFERLPAAGRASHPLQAQISRYANDCRKYPATP